MMWKIFGPAALYRIDRDYGFGWGSGAHSIGPEFHHSLHRCQRWNRRSDHILRIGISTGENRFLWRYFYYFRWIRLPARFVFVLWIVFQIIGAYEQNIGISSVSSFAHLGGAAVGVIAWFLTRKTTPVAA